MRDFFKKDNFKNLRTIGYFTYIASLLSVFIIPIHVQYLPPVMVLWGLFWVLEFSINDNRYFGGRKSYIILFVLFNLLYFWQAIGMIYSENLKLGFQNLFGRLSLILFPLVLLSPGISLKINIKLLSRIFAIGSLLYIICCFGYALIRSVSNVNGTYIINSHPEEFPWLSYFYSSLLTISQHPSYISMYILLSVFICFEAWYDRSLKTPIRTFWLVAGIALIVSEYYLSSRIGIFSTLILVPLYFIRKLYTLKRNRFSWVLFIAVILALLPIISRNQRVDYFIGTFENKTDYIRQPDPRILIWNSSLKLVRKNLLIGVGIGDVRTELSNELLSSGHQEMAKARLNAHNQFLEVFIENGIVGLIIFISIFICMTYIAFKDKNLLYGAFILIVLSFFMFESVLYRLAGVSFFSLFSFLLLHINSKKLNKI